MTPLYIVLNIALAGCYIFADWGKISNTIRKREGLRRENDSTEKRISSPLLAKSNGSSLSTNEYGAII